MSTSSPLSFNFYIFACNITRNIPNTSKRMVTYLIIIAVVAVIMVAVGFA